MFREAYLNRNFNDEMLNIWYVEKENKIIATMMMKQLSNNIGRIENVCCESEYRSKGINVKLLEEVIRYSREIGLKKLQVGTYEHFEKAIKFYEKNGFVEQRELRNSVKQSRYYELEL